MKICVSHYVISICWIYSRHRVNAIRRQSWNKYSLIKYRPFYGEKHVHHIVITMKMRRYQCQYDKRKWHSAIIGLMRIIGNHSNPIILRLEKDVHYICDNDENAPISLSTWHSGIAFIVYTYRCHRVNTNRTPTWSWTLTRTHRMTAASETRCFRSETFVTHSPTCNEK